MILNESKRDELLLPYLNILNEKGFGLSLGKFKGIMLDKLAAQGGMHNLSKASNFYLAGAVRYYFNGDLTLNKDLSILSGDPSKTDSWNEDVCRRLDTLIDILRNAYIDSVGTEFEQPEDFGTLPIDKLLRKYNKKICTALGIDTGTEKTAEKKKATMDPHVGNGYTFEILYNYEQGRKFENFTRPGAWCITYGQHHFNYYVKRLGIHYVIFLKDGYENVERKTGPGYTKQKPHDEYGNSMIAVLQSNNDWEPVYITSRWNHGHGDTSGTEADHAYTTQEFCQITGVTPEDLKNIYKVWLDNREKTKRNIDPEAKAKNLEFLRSLKYIQMRINGGENPKELLHPFAYLFGKKPTSINDLSYKDSVLVCTTQQEHEENGSTGRRFIVDKGRIVFESIVSGPFYSGKIEPCWNYYENTRNGEGPEGKMHDIVIIKPESGGYRLYDVRKHGLVEVDGTKAFKAIPSKWSSDYGPNVCPTLYQVMMSTKQIALINISNNMPLRLPNGEYWFNDMSSTSHGRRSRWGRRDLEAHFAGDNSDTIIEILYDESSREKFFYSCKMRRFIDLPKSEDVTGEVGAEMFVQDGLPSINCSVIRYGTNGGAYYDNGNPKILVDSTGKQVPLGEISTFRSISREVLGRFVAVEPITNNTSFAPEDYAIRYHGYNSNISNSKVIFDLKQKQYITHNNELVKIYDIDDRGKYLLIRKEIPSADSYDYAYAFFDTEQYCFLKNPFGYPSDYLFRLYSNGCENFTMYKSKPDREFTYAERRFTNPEFVQYLKELSYDELKRFPKEQPNGEIELNESKIRQIVSSALKTILENGRK